ncbi:MAG TPA: hypothetical protein EYP04_03950 [Anaerolineae bacterium]|nr:hypothetical protein [Anaerolineae bacterium]
MAQVFVDERVAYYQQQDKRDRIEVKIVDQVIDASLFKPKPWTNAAAGGILGLLIGGLIVFALESLEADVLRTPEAVERALRIPVLGAIPTSTGEVAEQATRPALTPAREIVGARRS